MERTPNNPAIQSRAHEGLRAAKGYLALAAISIASAVVGLNPSDTQAATLAIIDTGSNAPPGLVDPSLNYNAVDGSTNVADTVNNGISHGTSLEDALAYQLKNSPVLRAVCKDNCRVMAIKATDAWGNMSDQRAIANGVNHARTHGASVILMAIKSHDNLEPLPILKYEIAQATATQNIPVIMSAGTSDSPNLLAYSNQPNATVVTSVDDFGVLRQGVNGGKADLAVPSISPSEGSLKVAAVALAAKEKEPKKSAAEIKDFLVSTGEVIPHLLTDNHRMINRKFLAPTSDIQLPLPHPASTKSLNTLVVNKKGRGKLTLNGEECDPQCTYPYESSTHVRITAIKPSLKTKVTLPRQCETRSRNSQPAKRSRRLICNLPTNKVKKQDEKGQKVVTFSFRTTK